MEETIQSPLRILLVEDNEPHALLFQRSFSRANVVVDVTHETRAETALERLTMHPNSFDLVVADYQLPGITGLDFCIELVKQQSSLPMVLLTGMGSEDIAVKALKAGVNEYIVKDINKGYLDLLPVVLPGVVERHHDRLARRLAERALRQSEARYRAIVDDQTELISRFRPDGVLTFVNDAYCRYYKKQDYELLGENFLTGLLPQTRRTIENHLASLTETKPVGTIEHPIVLNEEDVYWQQWTHRAIFNEVGYVTEFQSVGRDVTDRRQAEDKLRQYAAELEIRNEELDAFAHTVAHDLQNPLAALDGFANILLMEYVSNKDDEFNLILNEINTCTKRVSRIVDELLILSSVRKKDVQTYALNMDKIIKETIKQLTVMIDEYEPHLVIQDTWPVVLGYAPWVQEVWANYISNALKYGGKPPYVELGATEQADGKVCFWVKDNGQGLAEEQQAKLFTQFTQLNQIRAKGYGLGLSIVLRIIQKLDGSVGVESRPGEGSIFYFTLPATSDTTYVF